MPGRLPEVSFPVSDTAGLRARTISQSEGPPLAEGNGLAAETPWIHPGSGQHSSGVLVVGRASPTPCSPPQPLVLHGKSDDSAAPEFPGLAPAAGWRNLLQLFLGLAQLKASLSEGPGHCQLKESSLSALAWHGGTWVAMRRGVLALKELLLLITERCRACYRAHTEAAEPCGTRTRAWVWLPTVL